MTCPTTTVSLHNLCIAMSLCRVYARCILYILSFFMHVYSTWYHLHKLPKQKLTWSVWEQTKHVVNSTVVKTYWTYLILMAALYSLGITSLDLFNYFFQCCFPSLFILFMYLSITKRLIYLRLYIVLKYDVTIVHCYFSLHACVSCVGIIYWIFRLNQPHLTMHLTMCTVWNRV